MGVVATAACSVSSTSEPPPYPDGTVSVFWSTDEPAAPSPEWLTEAMAVHAVASVLVPSAPANGTAARVTLRIGHEGMHSFFEVGTTGGGLPGLRVGAANDDVATGCPGSAVPLTVRDTTGCLTSDIPGEVLLTWEDGWVHRARWLQPTDLAPGHHGAAVIAWLDTWTVHRR